MGGEVRERGPIPGIHVTTGEGYTLCGIPTFGCRGDEWMIWDGGGVRMDHLPARVEAEYRREHPRCAVCDGLVAGVGR